jgi:hypothetical protein
MQKGIGVGVGCRGGGGIVGWAGAPAGGGFTPILRPSLSN